MARDAIQTYLNEIGRYPLLTKAQEIILGTQVQAWMAIKDKDESEYTQKEKQIAKNGKRAREKFINCNLRLVVNIARKYLPRCTTLDLMDLVQEGNIGLARAVEKFDPTRGYAMSTYAYWWIRQAIQRSMQFSDLTIRLSIGAHDAIFQIKKAIEVATREMKREPTLEEISEIAGLSVEEIKIALNAPRAIMSLDVYAGESDKNTLIEFISDDKNSNTIEDAEERINKEDAYLAVENYLDEMTKFVILERLKDPPTTWREICAQTGLTRDRLQAVEKNGLERCSLILTIKNKLDI